MTKGWTWKTWTLAAVGSFLVIASGILLFFQYYPQYHPDYLAWKKQNPDAPYLQYQAEKAGRKNSDGGGAGRSLRS